MSEHKTNHFGNIALRVAADHVEYLKFGKGHPHAFKARDIEITHEQYIELSAELDGCRIESVEFVGDKIDRIFGAKIIVKKKDPYIDYLTPAERSYFDRAAQAS